MQASRRLAAHRARISISLAALLAIGCPPAPLRAQAALVPSSVPPAPQGGARVTGKVTGLVGPILQLQLRDGRSIAINLRVARAHDQLPLVYTGEFLQVQGQMTGRATMNAQAVMRAKSAPSAWSADIR